MIDESSLVTITDRVARSFGRDVAHDVAALILTKDKNGQLPSLSESELTGWAMMAARRKKSISYKTDQRHARLLRYGTYSRQDSIEGSVENRLLLSKALHHRDGPWLLEVEGGTRIATRERVRQRRNRIKGDLL